MCRPPTLSAWATELASAFPALSRPQVKVLAEYSLGMVLAGRCGLSSAAFALAEWLGQTFDAARERLRDWYRGAADKSGAGRGGRRRELRVEDCFGPLLAWVLRDWDGPDLAIALDATTLGTRFVVLAVAVVYRGGAVPVARGSCCRPRPRGRGSRTGCGCCGRSRGCWTACRRARRAGGG